MAVIPSNPSMQDLNITFQESGLVFPLHQNQTEKRSFFLSNIDQILNYRVPTLYFFPPNPDYPPHLVSHRLKLALQKLLLTYDYVAGRLKMDHHSGRLLIDCNAAGAGFVLASSPLSLPDIGDLLAPNLGFQNLAVHALPDHTDEQPLLILQLTSFRCGGFAIGMSVNHILLDGMSAKDFNLNLASQAFHDKPLAVVPCLDRRLMAARSPPRVEFKHPEFFKPDIAPVSGPPVFDCKKEELQFRVFQLSQGDIELLKGKAREGGEGNARVSSLSVAAALIWRCKALSKGDQERGRASTLLNVIDLRSRLEPPLPASYCGNALLVAYSTATCEELEELAFAEVVRMVAEGPGRVSDEYARSVIDWLEINKGLPCGEYMVSSWLRLGFGEVVFPWGKPLHAGPAPNHRKDICWVFPTSIGHINALVSLPPPEMERFETQFRMFFTQ